MTITTPTVRGATRRWAFWIAAGVVLLLFAVGTVLFTGAAGRAGDALSASNAAPAGSKALAEVLRQHGVTVTATSTLAATTAAITDPRDTTLFLYDPKGYLDAKQYEKVAGLAADSVLVSPGFSALAAVAPGVAQAGRVPDAALTADCDVPAVRRAGSVSGGGTGFRITAAERATGCLAGTNSDNKGAVFSLVRVAGASGSVTVLGLQDVFANEHVAERGNAALALGLLGEHSHLVWYLPSVSDVAGGAPTLAELTPQWVPGVMILLLLVVVAAAFWRGRRLGPLVVENLPVVVRASETMEGRARLYQKSSARLHALDALRIGAVQRLAAQCGQSRLAGVDEVAAAVAAMTRADPARIRDLLVDAVPATDRELVRLSDELLELERAARAASGTGANTGE
ncbi:DUF4350 domain-containing protein [Parafrigoribacterium mesophilum]|uniref:DUF4350 domain-containing protein n=1 Tax=Parafrigoribacterium mesophilum TaxID=433646 RepID=UPI0031FE2520